MAGEAIMSGVVGDMVGRAMSLLAGHLWDQQRERSAEAKLRRLRRLLVRVESAVMAAGARRITSRALLAWLVPGALPPRRGDGKVVVVVARSSSLPSSFNPAVAARRLLFGDADGSTDELDRLHAAGMMREQGHRHEQRRRARRGPWHGGGDHPASPAARGVLVLLQGARVRRRRGGPVAGQAIAKKLLGSFFGGKIVGELLRSRQDLRLWRCVLSSSVSITDVPCLGNGGYVAAAGTSSRGVTVSGLPVRGLGRPPRCLFDVSSSSWRQRPPELPVLLCKSVFPFYCLYYTAHCTIDRESKR